MGKSTREARKLLEAEGLVVLADEYSGGTHLRVHCRRADGAERFFMFPNTPSKQRWVSNKRAEVRRWARETRP